MSKPGQRYIFAGHAIGAAAQFHKLDKVEKLNYIVPTLGVSVLPVTGGVSKSQVLNYFHEVDNPRRRSLLSVRRIETSAVGREAGSQFDTEVDVEVESIEVVDKLHIGFIKAHILSTRQEDSKAPAISAKGTKIEAVRLGAVEAKIVLDEDPLQSGGNMEQLAAFYRSQTEDYRRKYSWRFGVTPDVTDLPPDQPFYVFSLVREITLDGPDDEKAAITVKGNTIRREDFGTAIFGELLVKKDDRRLTMVRLAMGSDDGGDASIGEAESNGSLGSG
jgi:hypothetical protein